MKCKCGHEIKKTKKKQEWKHNRGETPKLIYFLSQECKCGCTKPEPENQVSKK